MNRFGVISALVYPKDYPKVVGLGRVSNSNLLSCVAQTEAMRSRLGGHS